MAKEEEIIKDFLMLGKFDIPTYCWEYETKKACYFYWESMQSISRGLVHCIETKCKLWDARVTHDHKLNVSPCAQCRIIKELLK